MRGGTAKVRVAIVGAMPGTAAREFWRLSDWCFTSPAKVYLMLFVPARYLPQLTGRES